MTNVAAERRRAAAKARRVEGARLAAVQIRALAREGMGRLYVSDADAMFALSAIVAAVDLLTNPDANERLDNLSMLRGATKQIERLSFEQLADEDERAHAGADHDVARSSQPVSVSDPTNGHANVIDLVAAVTRRLESR